MAAKKKEPTSDIGTRETDAPPPFDPGAVLDTGAVYKGPPGTTTKKAAKKGKR